MQQDPKPSNKNTPEQRPQKSASALSQFFHDLVYLLVAVLILFLIPFRLVTVSGSSMMNTLLDGDYLLLVSSDFCSAPEQGDVVVISKHTYKDGDPIVKRVIATEGQVVDIDFHAGVVYIDGVALEEEYILNATTRFEGVSFPLTVDPGCVFVLGDNRDRSLDSRNPEIGQIDCREIVGKAVFLFLPGTNNGAVERDFSRIGGVS